MKSTTYSRGNKGMGWKALLTLDIKGEKNLNRKGGNDV